MDHGNDEYLNQFGESYIKPWPQEILSEFIAAYRSMPQLWDPKHKHYSNRSLRNSNLMIMRDIYRKFCKNATIADVKRKINSLRSQYKKYLRKRLIETRIGCSEEDRSKPRHWVFNALQFLSSTMKCESQEGAECNETVKGKGRLQTSDSYENYTDRLADSNEDSDSPKSPNKKRVKRDRTEEYILPIREQSTCDGNNSENNSDASAPEVELWVNKLSKLQPMQRLYAEKAINDVLFEAQLGNLTQIQI